MRRKLPTLAKERSLRQLALRGSAFELVGYGAGQVLRLVSNLILSRLLFPEAFGLMALLAVINYGLAMLTDMGIEQAVIQNARGDEPRFLNTAWTIHVVRSTGLWLIACAIAWPAARFYHEPELLIMLPVNSAGLVVTGFASTKLFTLRRRLSFGMLNALELATQMVALVSMSLIAWRWPSAWAIVFGGLISSFFRTIASHLLPVEGRSRFAWDKSTRDEIFHFGKFIFGSSALSFAGGQADRVLLGRYMGMEVLGIYSVAVNLSDVMGSVITRLTYGVLYPVLSRVGREEGGVVRVRAAYYRSRLYLDLLALVPLGVLLMCSDWVVHFLYDERYQGAIWILKLLCIRVALASILVPCETCLFALGHTRYGLYRNIARAVWVLPGVPIAHHLAGLPGILAVIVLAEVPVALVLWPAFIWKKVFSLLPELRAPLFFGVGLALGWVANTGLMHWAPDLRLPRHHSAHQ